MEFYKVLRKRRTHREWLDKNIDIAVVKRILDAANYAPTWNNNRNWQFVILRTEEEKASIFEEEKKEAKKFNVERETKSNNTAPTTILFSAIIFITKKLSPILT